ncbi:MAG: ABC transporter ATP-binding protein [Blastocatellia bacterium]|jgi:lipoprotein-releasing system ATP-binding protein
MKQPPSPSPVRSRVRGEDRILLEAEGLTKAYRLAETEIPILEDLSLTIRSGEMVAIVGASGAGKSTLLHLLGGLDRPTAGSVRIDGFDITKTSELDLSTFRNRQIGFVFQFHHLLPEFTALENVMMPLLIGGLGRREARVRAGDLIARVGLAGRAAHRPGALSGGEQQRVALARALVAAPCLLLADEPTGNLDHRTGADILQLLLELRREERLTAILVTHNEDLAAACDRVLLLADRRLVDSSSS